MVCAKCLNSLNDEWKCCPNCGTTISEAEKTDTADRYYEMFNQGEITFHELVTYLREREFSVRCEYWLNRLIEGDISVLADMIAYCYFLNGDCK